MVWYQPHLFIIFATSFNPPSQFFHYETQLKVEQVTTLWVGYILTEDLQSVNSLYSNISRVEHIAAIEHCIIICIV